MTSSFTDQAPAAFPDPAALLAQVDPGAVAKVWYFLTSGGFFMAFIALCSLVALSVVIYKALTLRRKNVIPRALEHELLTFSTEGNDGTTAAEV